jgi:hypothetical protein
MVTTTQEIIEYIDSEIIGSPRIPCLEARDIVKATRRCGGTKEQAIELIRRYSPSMPFFDWDIAYRDINELMADEM